MKSALLFALLATLVLPASVLAAVPALMNYQGRLTDSAGQPVPDGTVNVRFSLHDAATGGNLLWAEPASGTRPVQTQGGLFNVVIGAVVPLPDAAFTGNTWLQTEINGSVLASRVQIVSVGYALRAKTAETVPDGAIGSAQLAYDPASLTKASGNAMTSVNGNIGIGTASPGAGLEIRHGGDAWGAYNYGKNLLVKRGANAHPTIGLFDNWGNNPWAITNAGGSLCFSGMPELTDSTTAPSQALRLDRDGKTTIYGTVGIGTTTPQAKLHVAGAARVDGQIASESIELTSSTPFIDFQYGSAATEPYNVRLINQLPNELWMQFAEPSQGVLAVGGRIFTGQGAVFSGDVHTNAKLVAHGIINATEGISFPDGSVQTTAATPATNTGVYNVRDYGAVGDGVTDDAPAFRAALAAAPRGSTVKVPPGRYLLGSQVTVRQKTLYGNEGGLNVAATHDQPVLVHESTANPLIRLGAGGAIVGLTLHSEGEVADDRPAMVLLDGAGTLVSNVKFDHPSTGILASGAAIDRTRIERCLMYDVRNIGIKMYRAGDACWVSDVQVFGNTPAFLSRGIGIQLGSLDVITVSNCFILGANRGIYCVAGLEGVAGGTWGTITGANVDMCNIGIEANGGCRLSIDGGTIKSIAKGIYVHNGTPRVAISGLNICSNVSYCVQATAGQLALSGCVLSTGGSDAVSTTGTSGQSVAGNLQVTGEGC